MSKKWLCILEGDDPKTARPVIATEDPELIAVVVAAIAERLSPGRGPRLVEGSDEGEP